MATGENPPKNAGENAATEWDKMVESIEPADRAAFEQKMEEMSQRGKDYDPVLDNALNGTPLEGGTTPPAREGNRFSYYPRGRVDAEGNLGVRLEDKDRGHVKEAEGRGETNEEYGLRNKWMTEMTRWADQNPLQEGEHYQQWKERVGAPSFEEWKAAQTGAEEPIAAEGGGENDSKYPGWTSLSVEQKKKLIHDNPRAAGEKTDEWMQRLEGILGTNGNPEAGTGEKPEAGAEAGSEANEKAEHERLINGIFDNYATKIYDAAERIGMSLDNIMDLREMGNDELTALYAELNKTDAGGAEAGAEETGETEAGAETGAEAGEAGAGAAGAAEADEDEGGDETDEDNGAESGTRIVSGTVILPDGTEIPISAEETAEGAGSEENGAENADDEAEELEERKVGFFRKIGRRMGEFIKKNGKRLGILALATTLLFAGSTQLRKNMQDRQPGTTLTETDDGNLDDRYNDAMEAMESQGIIDGYGEEGMWSCDTKTGKYNFADAEAVAEAVETNDAREMLKYTARNQSESFADYMVSMPDEVRPESLRGITDIREMEKAIENLSNDEHKAVFENFSDVLDNATVKDITLNGRYDNAYMRLKDSNGDVTHDNMELVRCTTTENGTHAQEITLHDKDGNVIGTFIVKANTNTSIGKKGCMQVVRPEGSPELSSLDEIPENPDEPGEPTPTPDTPTPETPTPTPDTPTPDTPTPTPDTPTPDTPTPTPETPEPDSPTPELEAKDPEEIKKNMDVSDDESTNDLTQMEAGEQTERPETNGDYNPDTQTFGDTNPEAGTGDTDGDGVVNSGAEQTGAQDTSLESADGSGRTIEQVIQDADTSAVTDTGERVSEQENRTPEDTQAQQQQEAAHAAEEQTVQEQAQGQQDAADREAGRSQQSSDEQAQERENVMQNLENY